ncbi:hypothetical protein AVEN_64665-1 [Araneus ventricosus]|uniref:Uncharacterized protein n=1 Tax=Araneus ventricosus TaxID=182803 RepID=A0A4Y2VAQ5_ARAVE|nr:hypothetical protein AVEN_252052-1 [Araneus ventricosus]GBO21171.1 hypothetical protein AVEN_265087-1 [Araneus ventricosus]GBO21173.1 hypothetical protein AVEN_35978-1 [Araneus ventricosus]GBO21176.1 hypothetical protein AVEN_64665-1 [Araneus ventricosus]
MSPYFFLKASSCKCKSAFLMKGQYPKYGRPVGPGGRPLFLKMKYTIVIIQSADAVASEVDGTASTILDIQPTCILMEANQSVRNIFLEIV